MAAQRQLQLTKTIAADQRSRLHTLHHETRLHHGRRSAIPPGDPHKFRLQLLLFNSGDPINSL